MDQANLQRGQLKVTNAVGMELLLAFDTIDEAYERMRFMGARGWSTGPAPAGGFTLPYAMAETFDFSLIGAHEFTFEKDGEKVRAVEHRGQIYTRRDMPATTKGPKKMPAKIWYSRGAKAHDGATKEEDGGIAYVSLIQFVGGGRSIAEFERPQRAPQQQRPATRPVDAKPPGDTLDQDLAHRSQSARVSIDQLFANLAQPHQNQIQQLRTLKKIGDTKLADLARLVAGGPTFLPEHVPALVDALKREPVAA